MSKRAEQRGLEALPPRWRKTKDGKGKIDGALPVRKFYIRAYEQAEKDILSKITKEHLDGLKWIERAGITSQPYPYHKYCKDLRKILETLLNDD